MAPPLLPITRLIACPACAEHIKSNESVCPHCGAENRGAEGRAARAATAVLMGIMLSGCPDKEPDPTSSDGTDSGSGSGSSSDTGGSSSTGDDSSGTTFTPEPEYGVPVTTSGPEPDYGVPSTESASASGEPDYGVPGTDGSSGTAGTDGSGTSGPEPLYGSGAL